jgi:hypothetical protein
LKGANVRKRGMNFEVWGRKFAPCQNHIDSNASFDGCLFETYGQEEAFVKEQDFHKVWTLVDGDTGDKQYLLNGFHHVNRIWVLV